MTRSPRDKCLVAFDGKMVNLTGKLRVKFYNEDYDSPSVAPPYGLLGFTPDEKHVFSFPSSAWERRSRSSASRVLRGGRF